MVVSLHPLSRKNGLLKKLLKNGGERNLKRMRR